jgi:hypothetical protein
MPGRRLNWADLMEQCPFRTLLGDGIPPGATLETMLPFIGCTIGVLGGAPEPLTADVMRDALEVISQGKLVLLVSDRADLRDYAKREIAAMAGPVGGVG